MIGRRNLLVSLFVVALVQTAALGWMVVARDRLIKTGREVVMAVQPIDPRDMFRGDYVTLGYPMTVIAHTPDTFGPLPQGIARDATIYVVMTPGEADAWSVRNVYDTFPANVAPGDLVLKGRVLQLHGASAAAGQTISVRYGIERYFVPEGTGKDIEQSVRDHTAKAVLAVAPDGQAAIKGLIVGGVRIDAAPIF